MRNKAYIVVGLGFGDEGKGAHVDYLCAIEKIDRVIRFNGGAQAAHNVVLPNGQHHEFNQLGSGSFRGVPTFLSRFMMVNPLLLAKEIKRFRDASGIDPLPLLYIDERAPILTPFHSYANRLKEHMRADRHGTCGHGIGELAYDMIHHHGVIRAGEMGSKDIVASKIKDIRDRKIKEIVNFERTSKEDFQDDEELNKLYQKFYDNTLLDELVDTYSKLYEHYQMLDEADSNRIVAVGNSVFEGAQGVLLDEEWGFHPHTTWSKTTPQNAFTLLQEAHYTGRITTTGITRCYHTRHGHGPFPTNGLVDQNISPLEHNRKNDWQGSFRSGALDGMLLQYAGAALRYVNCELDNIAVTHLDVLSHHAIPICDQYQMNPNSMIDKIPLFGGVENLKQVTTSEIMNMAKMPPKKTSFSLQEEHEVIDFIKYKVGAEVAYLAHGSTSDNRRPA